MIALKDWVRSCSGLLREVKRAETGAVQEVLGVFGAAKGFCVPLQPQRSGGAAHVSIAASTERGMATRMRAVRSGTDAVRRSGHVQREQRVAGGWCGAGKDIQTAGCSLLRRAQESCGDDDRNREQTVFGLAVAGDDAAVYGGESRAFCGVEFVGQELSVCTSSARVTRTCPSPARANDYLFAGEQFDLPLLRCLHRQVLVDGFVRRRSAIFGSSLQSTGGMTTKSGRSLGARCRGCQRLSSAWGYGVGRLCLASAARYR